MDWSAQPLSRPLAQCNLPLDFALIQIDGVERSPWRLRSREPILILQHAEASRNIVTRIFHRPDPRPPRDIVRINIQKPRRWIERRTGPVRPSEESRHLDAPLQARRNEHLAIAQG